MTHWIRLVAVLLVCVQLAGCAVPRKFIRKRKKKEYVPVMNIEEKEFRRKFSNEYYYKKHYTLWKSWHSDLLNYLGGNSKKVARTAQEAYSHLAEMHYYLSPEKQEELKPHLEAMKKFNQKFSTRRYSSSSVGSMRVELEKIKRIVSNNFYYNKVKDHMKPDQVNLGTAGVK